MRERFLHFPARPPSIIVFFSYVLLSSLAACTLHRFPSLSSPTPLSSPSSGTPTAQELLTRIEAIRAERKSLRGLARVVYTGGTEKGTVKQAVAVSAPDRFRMELFSPVGIVSLVTTDGKTLAAYLPQDKILYRGAASAANVERFLRVLLSADEVTGFLLGVPILSGQEAITTFQEDSDKDVYRVMRSLTNDIRQELLFDRRSLRLIGWMLVNSDGATLARVTLADYRKVNGIEFPFEIILADVQGNQEAAIYYQNVELNLPLPDTLFRLAAIPGVSETNLDHLDP